MSAERMSLLVRGRLQPLALRWISALARRRRITHAHQLLGLVLSMLAARSTTVAAQDERSVLVGTVVDSMTLDPIPDVAAYLDGHTMVDQTDSTGVFRLADLTAGSHGLLLMRSGYLPQHYQFTVPDTLAGEIALPLIGLVRGPPPSAVVSGTVVDAQTGAPLALASVRLNGERGVVTGPDGNFRIDAERARWGVNSLAVTRMGYAPMQAELWVAEPEPVLDLDIALVATAVHLSELIVQGDSATLPSGRMRGFYDRMSNAAGDFITQEDIEDRKPRRVTELFRTVPGVYVTTNPGGGGYRIRMRRAVSGNRSQCRPLIFIDNMRTHEDFADRLDSVVWPEMVLGIEVYVGTARVPTEFNQTGSECGVVVIWTR
jgi:hypothetical protein